MDGLDRNLSLTLFAMLATRSLVAAKKRRHARRRRLAAAAQDESTAEAVPPATVRRSSYWRRLCPWLHVGDEAFCDAQRSLTLTPERLAALRAEAVSNGFFLLSAEQLCWRVHMPALCAAAEALRTLGWPASMLLMYDETWAVAHHLTELMAAVSGGNTNSFDMLLWNVCAAAGEAGFAPHRDRQPSDVPASFHSDGTPKYLTAWVALSEASTESSCLYLLPAGADPGYAAGDDHSAGAEDPLHKALRSDKAVQAIRACPLSPGQTSGVCVTEPQLCGLVAHRSTSLGALEGSAPWAARLAARTHKAQCQSKRVYSEHWQGENGACENGACENGACENQGRQECGPTNAGSRLLVAVPLDAII